MSGIQSGLMLFGILMLLLVVRVPIGIAMFMVGAGGYVAFTGGEWTPLLNSLKNLAYARLSNYDLVVIPLFLLMGQFATHGGLSRSLFRFVSAFMGHWRGGIAMAAVGACAALRRDLRLVAGHGGDHGPGRAARTRPRQVLGRAGHRRAGRRRHAGHHDSAVGAAGDLRHPHAGVDRQAVHGRDRARA